MDNQENKPFIFKTIGAQGELRYRGLDQMADILQIAYDLFQDPYLTDDLGDPFIGILETNPNEHKTFNRSIIERTILDCNNYGKIKFGGKHISVCSQGIENSLSELEMIWFVAHYLKKAELEKNGLQHSVPKIVKLTSMGKLVAILKYFLQTSYSLIADVRTKQLKEQLAITKEQDRKKMLLRFRTDLKIQKHETQPIVDELLRVIELELEFLEEIGVTISNLNESQIPIEQAKSSTLPTDIVTDFNYELSIKHFPWDDVIKKNVDFLQQLKSEFEILPLKPKLHWYFNKFISDEEWEKDRLSSKPLITSRSKEIIAANFVMPSEIETRANEIIREFNEMVSKNSVDPKYYGRMLEETDLVRTLKKLRDQLTQLKGYVFTSADINTFSEYGKAAAQSILAIISKLNNNELSRFLLHELMEMDIATDITVFAKFVKKSDEQRAEILHKFNTLSVFTHQVFNEAIIAIDHASRFTSNKVNKPKFSSIFKNKESADGYIEILRQVSPPIIGNKNDYLLGGRKKSSIVLWFDLLSKKGVVFSNIPPSQKAELLNEMFHGLSISERSTSSVTLPAEQAYGNQFEYLISKI
ncbi:hypothetical protein [Pedobacter sp. D749]|uniref:hypothetical protein n=1 Tax=Pedobacter sp. D749 TaxID=2856523 RepID=UPI001C564DDD|nr:hypothetical protein [Pedobacter sp. D749]QXU42845.1 hypothetical protein KYH19_04395 [Pedobacter sp. D749]